MCTTKTDYVYTSKFSADHTQKTIERRNAARKKMESEHNKVIQFNLCAWMDFFEFSIFLFVVFISLFSDSSSRFTAHTLCTDEAIGLTCEEEERNKSSGKLIYEQVAGQLET